MSIIEKLQKIQDQDEILHCRCKKLYQKSGLKHHIYQEQTNSITAPQPLLL